MSGFALHQTINAVGREWRSSDTNYAADVEKNNVLSFIGASDPRPWCLYCGTSRARHEDG